MKCRSRPRHARHAAAPARSPSQRVVEIGVRRAQASVIDPELRAKHPAGVIVDVERESGFVEESRRDAQQFEGVGHAARAGAGEQRRKQAATAEGRPCDRTYPRRIENAPSSIVPVKVSP